jgi:hypothetical protein
MTTSAGFRLESANVYPKQRPPTIVEIKAFFIRILCGVTGEIQRIAARIFEI